MSIQTVALNHLCLDSVQSSFNFNPVERGAHCLSDLMLLPARQVFQGDTIVIGLSTSDIASQDDRNSLSTSDIESQDDGDDSPFTSDIEYQDDTYSLYPSDIESQNDKDSFFPYTFFTMADETSEIVNRIKTIASVGLFPITIPMSLFGLLLKKITLASSDSLNMLYIQYESALVRHCIYNSIDECDQQFENHLSNESENFPYTEI